MKGKKWTETEDWLLTNAYPKFSNEVLAIGHNRSVEAIRSRAKVLGLKKAADYKRNLGKTTFTEYEDLFIEEHYLTMPVKTIAHRLGRSGTGIQGRLKAMGLEIPREVIQQRIKNSQYKKGSIPANKGKKQSEFMTAEAIERTKATRYKKGNEPHNTLYDGCIVWHKYHPDKNTVEGYYFVRISLSKWDLLQRHIWKLVNGPIPKGHNIQFKDGNTRNCVIENLYMVDRKNQLVHNKNGGRKLPHELKKTLTLINKIKEKCKTK